MALSKVFLSEDQFTCSICLDIFIVPVSLPCGHNFCKACISKHWEGKAIRQCPLCKDTFTRNFKLCVNTGFKEVVENFKSFQDTTKKGACAKPGEVSCDVCLGSKVKAAKTCLVCVASYCEDHLAPHLQDADLKTHILSGPVLNVGDKICRKHNRMLELFCRKDMCRVCALCTDHVGHHRVPLEEEFEEKYSQLEQQKAEVQEMIQERQLKAQEISGVLDKKRQENGKLKANSVQVLTPLMVSLQRNLSAVVSVIDKKQKMEEIQAQVLIKELNKEVTELQRKFRKLESISSDKDHLQLIKRFHFISSHLPQTKNWSDVTLSEQPCVEDAKKVLVQMEENITKDIQQTIQDFKCFGQLIAEETPVEKRMVYLDLDSLPDGTKLDIIRQHYAVDVKLDPNTANDLLVFSKDLKEVQASHIWWFGNTEPHKFNRYAYVLGKNAFSVGRFYYEVQVTMKNGWDLGVVRESLRGLKTITPKPKNGVWIIRLRSNTKFTALNNVSVHLSLKKKPERVGVFVDCEQRQVSFYNVDTSTLIYTFTDCVFGGKIFPFFSPGFPEEGVNGAPLVISAVKKSEQTLDTNQLMKLILMVAALFFFFVVLMTTNHEV